MAEDDESEEGIPISSRLFWLLILGIVLVFVGIIVLVVIASIFSGSSSAGVVVFIGPFPIVFGSWPKGDVAYINRGNSVGIKFGFVFRNE